MKPMLTRKIIADAVERDLGSISQWSMVSEGEESQVFGISLGDEDFILRVNRLAEEFQKDGFCYRRFSSPNLPIPEVMTIGMIEQYAYCVSKRAAGITLQDVSPALLPDTVDPVAGVLRAIGAAPLDGTQGFGPFDARGIAVHESWRGFLTSIADRQRHDWTHMDAIVDSRWLERHLRLLMNLVPKCPEIRKLVHGDFGSNNVLVDDGRVTGVIDWSEALFGDPLYDIANIFFWRPWLACMEAQARYFEEQEREAMGDPLVLRCYQLRIGLQQVYETAEAGDEDDLRWAMSRCDALVADLSS